MKELKKFISGETIDLCIPTREFARESNWFSWFNNSHITQYLEQRGKKRNTPNAQEKFFMSKGSDRLILIISTKKKVYKGVASLSFINNNEHTCDIAIVTDFSIEPEYSPYASLEAIARITQYGFDTMKMKRISGAAHIKLSNWLQRMELLGYRIEGINRKNFIKNKETSDTMTITCLHDDYLSILKHRKILWDSLHNMKRRIRSLPKVKFNKLLTNFLNTNGSNYYSKIFQL